MTSGNTVVSCNTLVSKLRSPIDRIVSARNAGLDEIEELLWVHVANKDDKVFYTTHRHEDKLIEANIRTAG